MKKMLTLGSVIVIVSSIAFVTSCGTKDIINKNNDAFDNLKQKISKRTVTRGKITKLQKKSSIVAVVSPWWVIDHNAIKIPPHFSKSNPTKEMVPQNHQGPAIVSPWWVIDHNAIKIPPHFSKTDPEKETIPQYHQDPAAIYQVPPPLN